MFCDGVPSWHDLAVVLPQLYNVREGEGGDLDSWDG